MPQTISLLVVDDGTEIPIIATRTLGIGADFDLFKRSGYGTTQETQRGYVIVSPLDRLKETSCDPSSWTDRTMYVAHRALIDDFNVFVNGQTLDVRGYFHAYLSEWPRLWEVSLEERMRLLHREIAPSSCSCGLSWPCPEASA